MISELGRYVMEHTSHVGPDAEGPAVIDTHFIKVAVDESVDREQVIKLIEENPVGEFCEVDVERLRQGPSYIELGGWLGDQTLALRFMALGEAIKLWEVVTPEKLGATGEKADQLAGNGLVMITGYKPEMEEEVPPS